MRHNLFDQCEANLWCFCVADPESLTVAVGQSDVMHSRNLQAPVLAGYLTKLASSGLIKLWRKRWFVLRQDNCLYYYKTENVSYLPSVVL